MKIIGTEQCSRQHWYTWLYRDSVVHGRDLEWQ